MAAAMTALSLPAAAAETPDSAALGGPGPLTPLDYNVTILAGASTGDFAPYLQSAMTHGRVSSRHNFIAEASIGRDMPLDRRFSYGFKVDLLAAAAPSLDYERYADDAWTTHSLHPSRARVQQLYGEVKWRGVFLTLGMKEHGPALVNPVLSSGDLVESGNALPIPEARIGFVDFQDIPLTRGCVQIQGEISWGKMMDSDWWTSHYNRYTWHVTTGQWYSYKRLLLRSDPRRPLSVTVGMQTAAIYAGETSWYSKGRLERTDKRPMNFEGLLKLAIPSTSSAEGGFVDGNHLGTWDFQARYLLPSGHTLKAYFSWPWEDGSGIGRRNGWDGLWGLEYSAPGRRPLSGAVIEYLDFTNQSGPIHYAPGDHDGSTITSQATGADDYYNNAYYNSYAYYGLSIGTPALMAPLYNLDGFAAYVANRLRGFHAAATGSLGPVDWRAAVSYRRAWGNGHIVLPRPLHSTSALLEASWSATPILPGLAIKGSLAIDSGTMPGNSFGAILTLSYSGIIDHLF